jgi:hypothetical protein
VKLTHLRERPLATLAWRHGWEWIAVEGLVQLAGPDDPGPRSPVRVGVEMQAGSP